MKRTEQYSDQIARLYPSKKVKTDDGQRILTQSITFQVTDDCNLACLYCYQGHKGKNRMSFETAKKFFDLVVSGEKGFKSYINPEKSPGLVVDFIGGEPFLEIELIDQICTYIMDKLIELDHPWAMKTMFSICSMVFYTETKKYKHFFVSGPIDYLSQLLLMGIKNYMIPVEFFQMVVQVMT